MATVLYTTTDNVRAAIGVTDIEITDLNILDIGLEDQLFLYFERVFPTHAAIAAANAVGQTPTSEQKIAWLRMKTLCMYQGAVIVLQAGQNLLFQQVTQGGTTNSRFSRNDIETTLTRLTGMRDQYLAELTTDPDADVSASIGSPLVRATPTYDPVTGC